MARKIARQSETTPSKTIDEYLWNERLGVTQLPPVDTSEGQQNMSSLPPQTSQAPTIDYDSANGQNDMFGSGVSSEGQPIAPKVPMQERSSAPAVSKAAAVSTLYGDVNPTPTTGESSGNGSQSGRNNSPDPEPNSPEEPSASNVAPEEEGGAGLASELGEAASLAAFANKNHWTGGVLEPPITVILEPKYASDDYKYIKHRNGKWVIIQKGTGKVLSTHDSREKAIASFKAMESHLHS